jgi:hypothetical protein
MRAIAKQASPRAQRCAAELLELRLGLNHRSRSTVLRTSSNPHRSFGDPSRLAGHRRPVGLEGVKVVVFSRTAMPPMTDPSNSQEA